MLKFKEFLAEEAVVGRGKLALSGFAMQDHKERYVDPYIGSNEFTHAVAKSNPGLEAGSRVKIKGTTIKPHKGGRDALFVHVEDEKGETHTLQANHLHKPINKEPVGAGGRKYEIKVADRLKQVGLMDKEAQPAGSSGEAPDAVVKIQNKDHNLEVKADKNAMFGQLELHHDDELGWHVSPRAAARYPKTANHPAVKKFVEKINQQWSKPTGDYETDLKMGNVYDTSSDTSPITAHYHHDRNTPYVQIRGHGLYHFASDKAKVGTSKLEGNTQLRARMKSRSIDPKTGKRNYGALIVMSLKGDVAQSSKDLDNDQHLNQIAGAK